MFFGTKIKYRLFRAPLQTFLFLAISMLLGISMGVYLGNIQLSEAGLESLSERLPVTVRILDRSGVQERKLAINTEYLDKLSELGVHNVCYTAEAAGAFSGEVRLQEPFQGGDTRVTAANALGALDNIRLDTLDMLDDYREDFLIGGEPLCIASTEYIEMIGAAPGDFISLNLYSMICNPYGDVYDPLGEQQLRIVGTYEYFDENGGCLPDLIVPINWLRSLAKQKKADFCYSYVSAVLDEPMYLTRFKNSLRTAKFSQKDLKFVRVGAKSDFFECDAVSVEDELFVKTAEKLQSNLRTFRKMKLPFCALDIIVMTLAAFLVLRGSRREMAICSALGESKLQIGTVHFISLAIIELAGTLLALPVVTLSIKIPAAQTFVSLLLGLCLTYSGTALALLILLRFDTLALLTKAD